MSGAPWILGTFPSREEHQVDRTEVWRQTHLNSVVSVPSKESAHTAPGWGLSGCLVLLPPAPPAPRLRRLGCLGLGCWDPGPRGRSCRWIGSWYQELWGPTGAVGFHSPCCLPAPWTCLAVSPGWASRPPPFQVFRAARARAPGEAPAALPALQCCWPCSGLGELAAFTWASFL